MAGEGCVGGARLLRAARHRLRVEVQTLAALRLRLERVARNREWVGGCAHPQCLQNERVRQSQTRSTSRSIVSLGTVSQQNLLDAAERVDHQQHAPIKYTFGLLALAPAASTIDRLSVSLLRTFSLCVAARPPLLPFLPLPVSRPRQEREIKNIKKAARAAPTAPLAAN